MSSLKPYPMKKLPLDEIEAEIEKIFPGAIQEKREPYKSSDEVLDEVDAEIKKLLREEFQEEHSLDDPKGEVLKRENREHISPDLVLDQLSSGGFMPPPMPFQPSSLLDVNAASMEHLKIFLGAVTEVALNTQAPGRMIVICALATIATIVQGLYVICSPLGGIHPLSLNTIVIALSGERKTTVDNFFTKVFTVILKVINTKIQDLNKGYESEVDKWQTDGKILKSAYMFAKKNGDAAAEELAYESHKQLKPERLDYLGFVHDDFTVSALLQSLYANMPVASIMTSEGAKVLDDANMKCVPFLNKLWDGASVQVTRVVRDSFWLRDACLSTSLMIQPDVLKKILDKRYDELRSSGYFARALVCYPQSNIGRRPVFCTQRYTEKTDLLHAKLAGLMIKLLRSLSDPEFKRQALELDQEAEQMWLYFANDVETKMNLGGIYESATDHASKSAENVLRLAGCLHAFEFGDGKISAKTLNAAIQIWLQCSKDFVDWFVPLPQDVQNGQRLQKYLHDNYGVYLMNRPVEQMYFDERFIRSRRVLQCGPLKNAEQMNQALGWLVRQGRVGVVEEVRPNGKGKGTVYIDLIPGAGVPVYSSNGYPLRFSHIN